MTRDKDFQKIVGLDKPALAQWIKDRLSGLPGLLPPQSSKGEDPEDLIVALHKSGAIEFKERVDATLVDLLKEQVASATRELDLSLLSRLAFLADALEVSSAAPLLMSFLFREELHGKSTPHGDLQELILRSLLGLNPRQFDSRFWKLHLEDPTFVAVALRGLAITDPPAAVRGLPRVFELATSGKIDTDAKLLLWRILSGWNHRELLALLAESMKGSSTATQSAINAAVEELPFEVVSKELFKTMTRPNATLDWSAVLKNFLLEPLSLATTPDVEPRATLDWSAVLKDNILSTRPDIEILDLGHKAAFYAEAKRQITSAKPTAVREPGYVDVMGYPNVHEHVFPSNIILADVGFSKNKEDLGRGRPGSSGRWTQMSFAGFRDPFFDSSTYWSVAYDAEFSEGAGDYEAILNSSVQFPSGISFGVHAGVNVPGQLAPVIKKNVYVSSYLSGHDVIEAGTDLFTRKEEVSVLRHDLP
jgi:hypothetical protein